MKIKVKVKPLSVNECWRGRRFKTQDYKVYEQLLMYSLPAIINIPTGKLEAYFQFGLSSKNADYDNLVKPFQDILQKKYNFNDKNIYRAIVEKVDVAKGKEFCYFELKSFEA